MNSSVCTVEQLDAGFALMTLPRSSCAPTFHFPTLATQHDTNHTSSSNETWTFSFGSTPSSDSSVVVGAIAPSNLSTPWMADRKDSALVQFQSECAPLIKTMPLETDDERMALIDCLHAHLVVSHALDHIMDSVLNGFKWIQYN